MRQATTVTTIEDLDYLAYIVRMWQVRSQGKLVWRASAATQTGERRVFADLAALFAFLEEKTVEHSPNQVRCCVDVCEFGESS